MRISDWSSDVCSSDLEATGITNKVVVDWRARSNKKDDLRPRITLLDENSGDAARYLLSVASVLSVNEGQRVEAGDVLARISRSSDALTSELQSLMRTSYVVFCLIYKTYISYLSQTTHTPYHTAALLTQSLIT